MRELNRRVDICQRALASLDEVLRMPPNIIVRDASIQRFEYSYETVWKLVKSYLSEVEGVDCNSPKRCFREALNAGLLSYDETRMCLTMSDDRNLTAHTYIEAVAEAIFAKLPAYHRIMAKLCASIRDASAGQPSD